MSWTKLKPARRIPSTRSADERRRRGSGKPSILQNQKVYRRVRKKIATSKIENEPQARSTHTPSTGFSSSFMIRILEGVLILAAATSMAAKSLFELTKRWWGDGMEAAKQVRWTPNNQHDETREERLEPALENDGNDHWYSDPGLADDPTIPLNGDDTPFLEEEAAATENFFREEVEKKKITHLEIEEEGISEEALEDQASALRAKISGSIP